MAIFGTVIGIDNTNGDMIYRVLMAQTNIDGSNISGEWQFRKMLMSKDDLVNSLNRTKYINVCIENNSIKGQAGSLDRFKIDSSKCNMRPVVILSELITSDGRTVGYKIVTYNGEVKNIILKELIAYCNRVTKSGGVPIQNAIFTPETDGVKAHIKSYPHITFFKETLQTNKNKYAEQTKTSTAKNNKALTKLEEVFSKEQIAELRAGKQDGVEIKIYANPALTPKQMRVLRKGLKQGVNVRPIAIPEYKPECMTFYIADLANGCDIRSYLSPKYSLYQLSELSLAAEAGLDISKIGNPKLTPTEMQEMRERMQSSLYKNIEVANDGSWKSWR